MNRDDISALAIYGAVVTVWYILHNRLATTGPGLIVLAGYFVLVLARPRNEALQGIILAVSTVFLYSGIKATTLDITMVVSGGFLIYFTKKPIKSVWKNMWLRVKLTYFCNQTKKKYIYISEYGHSATLSNEFDVMSLAGYRSHQIILFNKKYVNAGKKSAKNVYYFDDDKFQMIVKKKPKTYDDVVLMVI